MTFEVFAVTIASTAVLFAIARKYVDRSLRSYRSADAMLGKISDNLTRLAEADAPLGVARIGFMLAATTGCGCYVRGILYSHYMPSSLARLIAGGPKRGSSFERDLADLAKLNAAQRSAFSDLIVSVIIYDSYRNPLSGWLFRHMIRSYDRPSFTERADAEVTAVSILSRKGSGKIPSFAG